MTMTDLELLAEMRKHHDIMTNNERSIFKQRESRDWVCDHLGELLDGYERALAKTSEPRHRLCKCGATVGDAPCFIHGIKDQSGVPVIICSGNCFARIEAVTLSTSGWMLADQGWLCTECQPL